MIDPIEFARLEWTEEGVPWSIPFDDVYFSRQSGPGETEHVFLGGNGLPERWLDRETFSIGELGFGTGLNFFVTVKRFLETSKASAQLLFHSCEKYPLTADDMRRAISLFPEYEPYAKEFLAMHSGRAVPGYQILRLNEGRVRLALYLGDVLDFLRSLTGTMDVWFADGFSPARNEKMWSEECAALMAKHSGAGSTLSTFSAARAVRDAFSDAGFSVRKAIGFGKKRDMVVAVYESPPEKQMDEHVRFPVPRKKSEHVIVIGGGVAGVSVSHALALRGIESTIIEKEEGIARGSSGNPAGVIFPFVNAKPTPMSRYIISGFYYTHHLCQRLENARIETHRKKCGVVQIAHEERQQKRFDGALTTAGYPSEVMRAFQNDELKRLCGVDGSGRGVYFEDGAHLKPPAMCNGAVGIFENSIRVLTGVEAHSLRKQDNDPYHWEVLNEKNEVIAAGDSVVIANSFHINQFPETAHYPVNVNQGQIALVPADASGDSLQCVLCYDGYAIPRTEGFHVVGATYDKSDFTTEGRPENNRIVLDMLHKFFPDLWNMDSVNIPSRIGFRAISNDHLPLIGPVEDRRKTEDAARLMDSAKLSSSWDRYRDALRFHDGLYILGALGSRGLIYAPLGGEIIASMINNEPLPVERDIAEALHPSRFLLRELKKNL